MAMVYLHKNVTRTLFIAWIISYELHNGVFGEEYYDYVDVILDIKHSSSVHFLLHVFETSLNIVCTNYRVTSVFVTTSDSLILNFYTDYS